MDSFAQGPQGIDGFFDVFRFLTVGVLRTAFCRLQFGLNPVPLNTKLVELSVKGVYDSGRSRKYPFGALLNLPIELVRLWPARNRSFLRFAGVGFEDRFCSATPHGGCPVA